MVTGPTVILIGVALITTGIEEWGGGTYCASQVIVALLLVNLRKIEILLEEQWSN